MHFAPMGWSLMIKQLTVNGFIFYCLPFTVYHRQVFKLLEIINPDESPTVRP